MNYDLNQAAEWLQQMADIKTGDYLDDGMTIYVSSQLDKDEVYYPYQYTAYLKNIASLCSQFMKSTSLYNENLD